MLVWAHGLEGSPDGAKVRALRAAGLEVEAPDCRGLVLADRLDILEALTVRLAERRPVLAGSSYGGLAVAWLAARHPGRFSGLLLCAPALHHQEPPVPVGQPPLPPSGLAVRVLHGIDDAVVPIDASRRYVLDAGPRVRLDEVSDGHRLAGSLDVIVALAHELRA